MILKVKPPNYEKLKEIFNVRWEDGLVVTYDGNIYCKDGSISADLIQHELTHVRQQEEYGAEAWWERYYIDKEFRLEQEKEAYTNQIMHLRYKVSKRKREIRLSAIAEQMARMYGDMISYEDALEFVENTR